MGAPLGERSRIEVDDVERHLARVLPPNGATPSGTANPSAGASSAAARASGCVERAVSACLAAYDAGVTPERLERALIERAWEEGGGSLTRAAQRLGMSRFALARRRRASRG